MAIEDQEPAGAFDKSSIVPGVPTTVVG